MPVEYLTLRVEDRAVAIQLGLADLGQHRAPSIPDLLIAATAESAGLTVLHLDKDFELIEDTGQPIERLAVAAAACARSARLRASPDLSVRLEGRYGLIALPGED